jgi:hypothetical protein
MVSTEDASRFLAAGVETAIELPACVLFDRAECDELMCCAHKRKADR